MEEKTFVEAFTAKYLTEEEQDEDETTPESGIVILCPKSKPSATSHSGVVLEGQNITSAGDCKAIENELKNVKKLDLSYNCLGSWKEVESIIQFIPKLEFLNLASTPLSKNDETDLSSDAFQLKESVKVLVLNSTQISWATIKLVLSSLPCAEEVHLSLNNFTIVDSASERADIQPHPSVRKLFFNDNKVKSWSEVAKLGQMFPNLETLFLVSNFLAELSEDVGKHFQNLRQLSILDTNLSHWDEIDNLNAFPCLTEIQLQWVPLFDGLKEKESRQLVIARLPRITKLNNSPVFETEREDAERHFIREFMDAPEKPKRYAELFAMHHNVHRLAEVSLKPPKTVLIKVRFEEACEEVEIFLDETCSQLKNRLASHFGVPSSKVHMAYLDGSGNMGSFRDMKVPSAILREKYRIRDGDVILLEKK